MTCQLPISNLPASARTEQRATARPRQSSSPATEPTSGGGQLPKRSRSTGAELLEELEVGSWGFSLVILSLPVAAPSVLQ